MALWELSGFFCQSRVFPKPRIKWNFSMFKNTKTQPTDLTAISSLLLDGVIGVTDIVEAMHQTIKGQAWAVGAPDYQRTNGISGWVYWGIRTISRWVSGGVHTLHGQLAITQTGQASSPARDATIAKLNGVLGDHLAARHNPLAIEMQLRRDGIRLDRAALSAAIAQANGRIALMVHGSCKTDLQWGEYGHDHGDALARDLGLTPLYLFYNSGLHISENGRDFANLLEMLIDLAPQPLQLFIVAHSMGGLVTRSACHYAEQANQRWLAQLQKIVFLGTPHHGAPLERGGNWVDTLLTVSPYSAPIARLGKIRSSGVTDLRYGNVVDADWQGRDRFSMAGDKRVVVPLPAGIACYAAAATLSKDPNKFADQLIGDGLVPLNSALGRHKRPAMTLAFAAENQWIGREMSHTELLCRPEVYLQIKKWLED
jgi:pimeloyl-ACP methyl ester carboxylesterase